MSLDLDRRAGWPPELRILIDQYPRAIWPGHDNLGALTRFWLERHDGFRQLGDTLADATESFREERLTAQQFRRLFVPRLQVLLQDLEAHHQVEDLHFFPIFRAAERRLEKGFDVLESDHETIHHAMMEVAETANSLLRAMSGDDDARRGATDAYAAAGDALLKRLLQHLKDEEDLIVPVILDQSERQLFARRSKV